MQMELETLCQKYITGKEQIASRMRPCSCCEGHDVLILQDVTDEKRIESNWHYSFPQEKQKYRCGFPFKLTITQRGQQYGMKETGVKMKSKQLNSFAAV